MAVGQTTTLSVKSLSAAVASAVGREKNAKIFGQEFTIDHNLIMGRILREAIALNEAEAIADRITQQVQSHALGGGGQRMDMTGAPTATAALHPAGGAAALHAAPLQSAVLATHGRIICGFILDRQVVLAE